MLHHSPKLFLLLPWINIISPAWFTYDSNFESSSCSSDTTKWLRHLSTSNWPQKALFLSSCAGWHLDNHRQAIDNFRNISESCAFHQCAYYTKYSRFIKVWKPPSIKNMLFRGPLFGASMMISAAFQYSGWSNVVICGTLCLIVRSQIKYKVDKVHVLSPEYRSVIGSNTTDDWPGCSSSWWSVWIIPYHPGVSCLKFSESSQLFCHSGWCMFHKVIFNDWVFFCTAKSRLVMSPWNDAVNVSPWSDCCYESHSMKGYHQ